MDYFRANSGVPNVYCLLGSEANAIAPEKRMLSSMTPTIVEHKVKLKMVIGTHDISTIITSVLQNILNVVYYNMGMQESVNQPRFHHQWLPDLTSMESGVLSPDTIRLYEAKGHRIRARGTQGAAMSVYNDRENGFFMGAADSRRGDGGSVGY